MPSAPTPSPGSPGTPTVTVRYWAGARAAAGVDGEQVRAATVGQALAECLGRHAALAQVLAVATFLLDGRAVPRSAALTDGSVLEVLPPFAGG
ncbi:MAG: MoaD/ThiS family protein [Dermatophilaceae bacterium]